MKKIYISVCLMMVSVVGFGQWYQLTSGTTNHLSSVYFIDSNTGYVVGSNGTILKTTNGGANWTSLNSGTSIDLNSVFFTDANNGYTCYPGIILKTTNGGNNWASQTIQSTPLLGMRSIFFTDANTGFASGIWTDPGPPPRIYTKIFKTTNAGVSWFEQQNLYQTCFFSIFFPDENTGYAAGDAKKGKTTNAGNSWETWFNPSTMLRSIYCTNINTAYAVGWTCMMSKTTDGGSNWLTTQIYNTTTLDLNSVYFTDSNTGYAVGGFVTQGGECLILKTTDSGTNWSNQTGVATNYLISVFFPNNNTGYAVGANGTILKTTNGGVGFNEEIKKAENIAVNLFPNPVNNELIIEIAGSKEETAFEILNSIGQVVFKGKVMEKTVVNTNEFSAGVYIIKFENGKVFEFKKIVKE